MEDEGGCGSVILAFVLVIGAAVVGAGMGAVGGLPGAVGGGVLLTTSLLVGTLTWGAISAPWWALTRFFDSLPELTIPRALLGFVGGAVPTAVAGGFAMGGAAGFGVPVCVAIAAAYGFVAFCFAIPTGLFARHGMLLVLAFFGEVAAAG